MTWLGGNSMTIYVMWNDLLWKEYGWPKRALPDAEDTTSIAAYIGGATADDVPDHLTLANGFDYAFTFGGLNSGNYAVAFHADPDFWPKVKTLMKDNGQPENLFKQLWFQAEVTENGRLENVTQLNSVLRKGTGDGEKIDGNFKVDIIKGRGGGDIIKGRDGADRLFGNGGNDKLIGGHDNSSDILKGGRGNDKLYAGQSGADELFGQGGRDFLRGFGFDDLYGGGGRDRLKGDSSAYFYGGKGKDVLIAEGNGKFYQTGGEGADRFVYKAEAREVGDVFHKTGYLYDFEVGSDKIDLRDTPFEATDLNLRDIGQGAYANFSVRTTEYVGVLEFYIYTEDEVTADDFLF